MDSLCPAKQTFLVTRKIWGFYQVYGVVLSKPPPNDSKGASYYQQESKAGALSPHLQALRSQQMVFAADGDDSKVRSGWAVGHAGPYLTFRLPG